MNARGKASVTHREGFLTEEKVMALEQSDCSWNSLVVGWRCCSFASHCATYGISAFNARRWDQASEKESGLSGEKNSSFQPLILGSWVNTGGIACRSEEAEGMYPANGVDRKDALASVVSTLQLPCPADTVISEMARLGSLMPLSTNKSKEGDSCSRYLLMSRNRCSVPPGRLVAR